MEPTARQGGGQKNDPVSTARDANSKQIKRNTWVLKEDRDHFQILDQAL